LAPSPPLIYRYPSMPNAIVPIEWLGNWSAQSSINTSSGPVCTFPDAVRRESRPLTTHPLTVAPGGLGHGSDVPLTVPQRGAVPPIAASYVYATYTYGRAGNCGSSARPSSPRSQKLCTFVRRSAKIVGVGAVRLLNTLMRPLFAATKTRPSDANSIAVGSTRPEKTIDSSNPAAPVENVQLTGPEIGLPARSDAFWTIAVYGVDDASAAFGRSVAVNVVLA